MDTSINEPERMTWQRQEELRAYFMREQLWQFISIDEWLAANDKLDQKDVLDRSV